jgi:hypothetical protein
VAFGAHTRNVVPAGSGEKYGIAPTPGRVDCASSGEAMIAARVAAQSTEVRMMHSLMMDSLFVGFPLAGSRVMDTGFRRVLRVLSGWKSAEDFKK